MFFVEITYLYTTNMYITCINQREKTFKQIMMGGDGGYDGGGGVTQDGYYIVVGDGGNNG